MKRVVHATTVHPRDDVRILRKECVSLARAGYEVVLLVGDGLGEAHVEGVRIVDVGVQPAGRLARMRTQPKRAWQALERLAPALVQVHDPELLGLAARAAACGIAAVYDAHEDVPRQMLTKQWIPAPMRPPLSALFERYENRQVRRISAVIGATPYIAERFAGVAARSVAVCNYPLPDELAPACSALPRERMVCYVGGLMRTRGLLQMVRAVALLPGVRLVLCGRFEDETFERELRAEPGWAQVDWRGQVGREAVRDVMARACAGLVTLLPMPSYLDALPIKMFEYMSAALPVVASDFPLWRGIVESSGCGICVDPADPQAVAGALRRLLDDPQAARACGEAGRAAVRATYNWPSAERVLLALYAELLP